MPIFKSSILLLSYFSTGKEGLGVKKGSLKLPDNRKRYFLYPEHLDRPNKKEICLDGMLSVGFEGRLNML